MSIGSVRNKKDNKPQLGYGLTCQVCRRRHSSFIFLWIAYLLVNFADLNVIIGTKEYRHGFPIILKSFDIKNIN